MWMAEPINIEVARNATTPLGFQFWDEEADQPLNISGYAFECRVSTADGKSRITSHVVNITNSITGQYDIVFDGRAYNIVGTEERVVLSYQVLANDGVNGPVTAQRGSIFLMPGIL